MKLEYDNDLLKFLKPEPLLTVWEWADKHRILSTKSSAEPGKYRTNRTPYLKEIMAALSVTSPIEEIVFQKGAQIGATEIGNNWIGYIIDHSPAPVMMVQPTIDMAKKNSKTRIEPLIDECPKLSEKVSEKKSRDSSNTMLMKDFPGGTLLLSGANSASGLRSAPIRFLFLDETDAYKADVEGEGSPIKLARARTRTFSNRKIFEASTPVMKGASAIETLFEKTDQNYYKVPCLDCGFYQVITWPQIKWEKDKPQTAHFECVQCKFKMFNYQKSKLFERAKWVPERPENVSLKRIGFHVSGLYSPHGWYSWADAVEDFIDAKNDPSLLKVWVNTVLGESWKEKTEVPSWNRLYERRELYKRNTIPEDVCFLTAGADVQGDRIEVEIVGWCREKISYSIDYRILEGRPTNKKVWNDLTKIITEVFPRADKAGSGMGIQLLAIDSGYETQTVYSYVRGFPTNRVIAIKGSDTLNSIHGIPKAVDVTIGARRLRRGLRLWPVGVSIAKEQLYGWLNQDAAIEGEATPPGYCFFPEYDSEYFKMLTAEEVVFRFVKGYKKLEWQKIRERNEALDTRVYAMAAASVIGMYRFTEKNWSDMKNNFIPIEETIKSPQSSQKKSKKKKRNSIW